MRLKYDKLKSNIYQGFAKYIIYKNRKNVIYINKSRNRINII